MLNEDKGSGNSVFRITRLGREGYKNMDFEAPSGIASRLLFVFKLYIVYIFHRRDCYQGYDDP